jgi:hypothetical protein
MLRRSLVDVQRLKGCLVKKHEQGRLKAQASRESDQQLRKRRRVKIHYEDVGLLAYKGEHLGHPTPKWQ